MPKILIIEDEAAIEEYWQKYYLKKMKAIKLKMQDGILGYEK
jgi:hypothetical protein